MKYFVKLYWPMTISLVLFFVYGILIGTMLFSDALFNNDIVAISLLFLTFLSVIGVYVQMIYFIVKAANDKTLKGTVWWCIGIYFLNAFIVPYFNLKYICKDAKYKIKNMIFVLISIFVFIIGFILPFIVCDRYNEPLEINYNDTLVFRFPRIYKETKVGEYDIYVKDKVRNINFGCFVYDIYDIRSSEEILLERDHWIKSTRENVTVLGYYEKELHDRIIMGNIYIASKDKTRNMYYIFTVQSKDSPVIFNTIMVHLYDGNNYEEELLEILSGVEFIGSDKVL